MRSFFLVLIAGSGFTAFAGSAAAEITIQLPVDAPADHFQVSYDCGGQSMTVEYVNAGPVSLAVFSHEGEPVVAANVIAASGARYAGGRFVWWTKGQAGSLYDVTQGEDAAPIAECQEKS
mgnify:FL=1|jgi:Predicted periplasmic protein